MTLTNMAEGKKDGAQTLNRRMFMLHKLPESGKGGPGMTAKDLTKYLEGQNFKCSIRTVERDLVAINDVQSGWKAWGVELQPEQRTGEPGQPTAWSHARNSKAVFLRAMSNEQALMMSLVEQELRHFLPRSAYQLISAYVSVADQVLMGPVNARQARFRERVRIVPDGPEVSGPELNMTYLEEINEALLNEEQLELRYFSSREKVTVQPLWRR